MHVSIVMIAKRAEHIIPNREIIPIEAMTKEEMMIRNSVAENRVDSVANDK